MTPGDVARMLAKAAAYDQRTIGETDVAAWYEALADLAAVDALAAVTRHYRESTDRIMPAHVRAHAAALAKARAATAIEAARTAEPCEHGQPGGDQLHPISGKPLCPLCRLPNPKPIENVFARMQDAGIIDIQE